MESERDIFRPEPPALFPMTNVLNPGAGPGGRPLKMSQLRAQLYRQLLLTERVFVPGHSLVSHPVVGDWLKEDPVGLMHVIQTGRLFPLLTADEPTFTAAAEYRIAKASSGIRHIDTGQLLDSAQQLDAALKAAGLTGDLLKRVDLDSQKTEISEFIITSLHRILPQCAKFSTEIHEHFSRERDSSGKISGTWWNNLHAQVNGLAPFEGALRDIGTLVFDISTSLVARRGISGHPWQRTSAELVDYQFRFGAFKQREPIVLPVESQDERDLPEFMDDNSFSTVGVLRLLELEAESAREKRNYIQAVGDFIADQNEDTLRQVKSRFDEYILSLNASSHRLFPKLAQAIHTSQKFTTRLRVWRTSKHAAYGIATAGGAAGFVGGIFSGVATLFTAVGIGYLGKTYLDARVIAAEQKAKNQDSIVDSLRPILFSLPLKALEGPKT